MGTFCTATSLDTNMVGTTFNTATTSVAGNCITWAEQEIKKQLSRRYDLTAAAFQTSTSTPPLITMLCERLAESYLTRQLSRGGKESMMRAESLRKDVMMNLKELRNYDVDLFNTAGSIINDFSNTASRVLSNTDEYSQTFDEDDFLNWSVDSDKTDLIGDERE